MILLALSVVQHSLREFVVLNVVKLFESLTLFKVSCFQRSLDQRYGCMWHVVVGEEFSFDFDYEVNKCSAWKRHSPSLEGLSLK